MRCVASVLAAVLAAVPCMSPAAEPSAHNFLFFSGTDLWRHGGFAHGGMLWSPDGLDREGFAFKLMFGGGAYRYHSGALGTDVMGQVFSASLLPGWRWQRDAFTLTLFAGLDLQNHRQTPDDPGSRLHGTLLGLRIGADAWYEPTSKTMLAADASVSTIGASYSARAAAGLSVLNGVYIGPEIAGFATHDYRQWRLGIHATGWKFATFEWTAAAGYLSDSDNRDGAYARLSVLTRR